MDGFCSLLSIHHPLMTIWEGLVVMMSLSVLYIGGWFFCSSLLPSTFFIDKIDTGRSVLYRLIQGWDKLDVGLVMCRRV